MKRQKTIFIAAVLLFCCSPIKKAAADIYQFTDKNGTIHFTNVNGGGKSHKRVKTEPSRAEEPTPSSGSRASTPAHISSGNIPSAYLDIIENACSRHGVDPSLVRAMVKVESDFNPSAISRKGAMGLMQLMPQTALQMNVKNSLDPSENINGGVKYIKYLIDLYEGNISLALAAYNSGETAVKKWGTIPPFRETQNYVERILKLYNGGVSGYVTRHTIYMGYGDDGALILTDNPSNYNNKKFKSGKKNL